MQTPTRADLVALTDLLRSLRPDWDRWLVESVLQSHAHQYDLADLVEATVRVARDENIGTPKGLFWSTRHWRGLDTQPSSTSGNRLRCYVCGKTEAKCATERPGLDDDHEFEPVEPSKVPAR